MIFLNSYDTVLFQGNNRRGTHSGLKGIYFEKGNWFNSGIEVTYKNIPEINSSKSHPAIRLLSPTELIEWGEADDL